MNEEAFRLRLQDSVLPPDASISDAMAQLERAGTGAVMQCDVEGRLVGIVTDGDVRRAIMRGKPLDKPCSAIASRRPFTVRLPFASADALRVMDEEDIDELPVLDEDGVVAGLLLRKDLAAETALQTRVRRRLEESAIPPEASIREAIAQIERAGTGALLICDKNRRLHGLLTDGDVRRAVLRGDSVEQSCLSIATLQPITVKGPISNEEALRKMEAHDVNQLPILDADGLVDSLLLRRDLVAGRDLPLSAVIMAGGSGTRLRPLTEKTPKPMLPVGDRPLLELTIARLRKAGIREVNLTTHYLPESIVEHFGDGAAFGVNLNYVREERPMGTAGGLRLLKQAKGTLMVMNGDVLTGMPFDEFLAYHRRHKADLTVGVRKYDVQVPFGVVDCDDVRVVGLKEKPAFTFFINAGTYLLEPSVCELIPEGTKFDMTELIDKLIKSGRKVVSFPIMEYWLDVGRHDDYQRAQQDVMSGRIR